ncbi:MAG: PhoX family phosphatase [Hydrogenophaga sp.]|jgi:secreted PhoX family phosphatase|uniref:PhoX family protein n=1 Tax=Hydrogenophaga sp. TaxID=1904254 RepID=UPI002622D750|nr:PhoX family phosphatase [Hydrogenophaga sp.]MCW5669310.1 PhoX family phosphatase [Hydrogenophaga sp.]
MSHHDPEENLNDSPNEHFQQVLERATLSRRHLIRGGVGLAALSSIPFLAACGGGSDAPAPVPGPGTPGATGLGFSAIDKSLLDDVILPAGYTYKVVHATGDRLVSSIPAYSNLGTETDEWTMRVGDHHDGMDLFYVNGSGNYSPTETARALLVMNHESSADAHFFHPNGQTSGGVSGKKFSQFDSWDLGVRPELEVLKEINHHGVSVVEVGKNSAGQWEYKLDSLYNRRVTGQSPMRIDGPAAHLGDIRSFMVTAYDTTGATSRGTLNNCGHGKTPWGTYLACEENWAAYFFMPAGSVDVDAKTKASRQRYGVMRAPNAGATAGSQGWSNTATAATDDRFGRWDVSAPGASAAQDFRNEPNTFGYIVEIDPLTSGTSAKRVALGRFAHEAAVCGIPVVGQPLAFYMGCDSRNEYIYKFVSAAVWRASDVGGGMTAGDRYLNEGKLYVAKFNDNGSGEWIELNIANPLISGYATYAFANQADVLINARHAADAVGATKMDRPEWGAVNPANGEIYFTMTNSNAASRPVTGTNGANPRSYADNDGRAQTGNPNGHIIRFKESGGASTASSFTWDIFLFGAEADAGANINLSGLTAKNDFSSPDGLWFSKATGICWIQTDDGAYTDQSNCMLLAAIPGAVGDGRAITVNNSLGGVSGTQNTFIGAALGEAKLRRFMVSPKGAEVTGITESADGRAIFVNIQHPGENTPALGAGPFAFQSQWPGNSPSAPYGPLGRPRSATIVITRTDGGVIGR